MTYPLVSCICPTYDRPKQLEESIQCFLDQDYPNKELIVLVDNPRCEFILDCHSDQVRLVQVPARFSDLGTKYDYFKNLVSGDYVAIWEDDDLFGFNRLSDSIKNFKDGYDVIKGSSALMSTNNGNYLVTSNLFHSQSTFTRHYFDKTPFYTGSSIGVDVKFEANAKAHYYESSPLYWYIYRWGNCHHLSGRPDVKNAWKDSENNDLSGYIPIRPCYYQNYWRDIYDYYVATDKEEKEKWSNLYSMYM